MIDNMLVTAKQQPVEWQGQKSAKFTTVKRHIEPPKPEETPHPIFNMGGRTHFPERRDKEADFKPIRRKLDGVDHASEKPKGMRRVVADYPIVKPKIERLQMQHGVTPADLEDFVGPRNFLIKYKGVKQLKLDAKLEQERANDRQKRTFTQAGISVITREGEKTLTNQNAQVLKSYMNAKREAIKRARENMDQTNDSAVQHMTQDAAADFRQELNEGDNYDDNDRIGTYKYQERPDVDVAGLSEWEKTHFGGDAETDSEEER